MNVSVPAGTVTVAHDDTVVPAVFARTIKTLGYGVAGQGPVEAHTSAPKADQDLVVTSTIMTTTTLMVPRQRPACTGTCTTMAKRRSVVEEPARPPDHRLRPGPRRRLRDRPARSADRALGLRPRHGRRSRADRPPRLGGGPLRHAVLHRDADDHRRRRRRDHRRDRGGGDGGVPVPRRRAAGRRRRGHVRAPASRA